MRITKLKNLAYNAECREIASECATVGNHYQSNPSECTPAGDISFTFLAYAAHHGNSSLPWYLLIFRTSSPFHIAIPNGYPLPRHIVHCQLWLGAMRVSSTAMRFVWVYLAVLWWFIGARVNAIELDVTDQGELSLNPLNTSQ